MVAFKKNSNNKLNRIFNNRSSLSSNDFLSKNWLYCRWVLYTVFILSIGNIYYLLLGGDYFTLAVFILVAFLTTFFSKNMVVILCISLVISTILKSVQVKEGLELSKNDLNTIEKMVEKFGGVKEGNKSEKEDDKDTESSEKKDKNEKSDKSEKKDSSSSKTDKTDKTDKKDSSSSSEKPEKKDSDKKESSKKSKSDSD